MKLKAWLHVLLALPLWLVPPTITMLAYGIVTKGPPGVALDFLVVSAVHAVFICIWVLPLHFAMVLRFGSERAVKILPPYVDFGIKFYLKYLFTVYMMAKTESEYVVTSVMEQ